MRSNAHKNWIVITLSALFFLACSHDGPDPINLNKDNCDNCKMSISDKRFACEIVTEKGRAYKFDDVACMMSYKSENKSKMNGAHFYGKDYLSPKELILSGKLFFIEGGNVGSPMGGNIAAFVNKDSANFYANKLNAKVIAWETLNQ